MSKVKIPWSLEIISMLLVVFCMFFVVTSCVTTPPDKLSNAKGVAVVYYYSKDVVFNVALEAAQELGFIIAKTAPDNSYFIAKSNSSQIGTGELINVFLAKRQKNTTVLKIHSAPNLVTNMLTTLYKTQPKDSTSGLHSLINNKLISLPKSVTQFTEAQPLSQKSFLKPQESKNTEQPVKGTIPATIQVSQRWAVVIGVSRYEDSQIPGLRYADADAQSFHDWLVSPQGGRYSPARVKLLLNEQATLQNIREALFIWLKQPISEDVIIIYFAGHGSPESPDNLGNLFLLPYDTDYDKISATAFPMWDIQTALKRFIKAKKIIIIADACHAGGIGLSFDATRRSNRGILVNTINSELQSLSEIGDGIAVISASSDKQFSQESEHWGGGHGVFTYFLINGLKGKADYNKDNHVTIGELVPYLSEQVRRATKNSQSPQIAGRFDPALRIAR